jgi:hypothetical protein
MRILLILSIFIQGCFWQSHEDTLCRHQERTESVDTQGLTGDDIAAISIQKISSTCGSSDYKITEITESNGATLFKYRCTNVCDSEIPAKGSDSVIQ